MNDRSQKRKDEFDTALTYVFLWLNGIWGNKDLTVVLSLPRVGHKA